MIRALFVKGHAEALLTSDQVVNSRNDLLGSFIHFVIGNGSGPWVAIIGFVDPLLIYVVFVILIIPTHAIITIKLGYEQLGITRTRFLLRMRH